MDSKPSGWSEGLENSLSRFMVDHQRTPNILTSENVINSEAVTNKLAEGEDLFEALKIPLWIGKILGLVPIQRNTLDGISQPHFSWRDWRTFLNFVITLLIGVNVVFMGHRFVSVLTDTKRTSAGELVGVASGVWFYFAGLMVYFFFLIRSAELTKYFELWTNTSTRIQSTVEEDPGLIRDVAWLTAIVLGSCFGENLMFHFYSMSPAKLARLGEVTLEEVLHEYYDFNGYMYAFFDYHPLIAFALLVINKLALYAWNFSDLLLILLSRALFGRFRGLNVYLRRHLIIKYARTGSLRGRVCWSSVRRNFLDIVALLEGANKIFAPLIWLSYTTDIFFVCNQLYIELAPGAAAKNLLSTIYVIWSFLHLIMRTMAVSMMAMKINEEAHGIRHILQHCPPKDYDNDVRRLEEYVGSRVIGLSGNGCFVITRSFILMVMSAIFTLEVVLLQNSSISWNR